MIKNTPFEFNEKTNYHKYRPLYLGDWHTEPRLLLQSEEMKTVGLLRKLNMRVNPINKNVPMFGPIRNLGNKRVYNVNVFNRDVPLII